MYKLQSTPPGGGRVNEHGEWPTLKMVTLVARAIQAADPDTARTFSAYQADRTTAAIVVPLEPPVYRVGQAVEVAFSDGSVHWTDDLEQSFALANSILERDDAHARCPELLGDHIYSITTDGCGTLSIEDGVGHQLGSRSVESENPAAFADAVRALCLEAEDAHPLMASAAKFRFVD